ncbi:MAG: DUF1343 domain-containing protein [Bacteroidia bacterium]|nr:DUF1343 domain-containing protein [Bacteroidia bacterium]
MPLFSPIKSTLLCWVLIVLSCGQRVPLSTSERNDAHKDSTVHITVGANRIPVYQEYIEKKRVGIVANQTSVIFTSQPHTDTSFVHLVDSLSSLQVDIKRVFSPEHGFRGTADAGEKVTDGKDERTGIPIVSLYGSQRKPSQEHLADLDVVIFDIQDVGVRFYTYIATLQYVMEACAEAGIPILVLDRPNPNGHYVDGPTMELENRSFLGLNAIPLVYGMTIGEYALMINGEQWLENGVKADLTVIELENYTHQGNYSLPIRPSPNLPNDKAINLYPSLGLFEGTHINAGRGTDFQFQRFGSPYHDSTLFKFRYTPKPNFGSKSPKFNGEICFGEDLSTTPFMKEMSLQWVIKAYKESASKDDFFNTSGFTKHAGTSILQQQIVAGWDETQIKESWAGSLETFKEIRKKYLIYP